MQAAYASYLTSPISTSGSIGIPPPSLATSSAALSGLAAAISSGATAAELASSASPKHPLFPIAAFKNDGRDNDGAAADDDDDDEGRISPGVESPSQMLNGAGDVHKNNNVESSRLLLQGSIDSLRLRAKEMSAEAGAVDVKASAAAGDA